jgi:pimeloyl-ACP methyl ester carboxylesterase
MMWTTQQRSEQSGLACIVQGAGPRIVLIHGVGLCADAWNAQISNLQQTNQVIAVDMPGHGHSPCLPGDPNLQAYVDAIAPLVDAQTVVVGHSMGAMIALAIASRTRIAGVAALNAIFERSEVAKKAVVERAALLDGVNLSDPSGTLSRWFPDRTSTEYAAYAHWLETVSPQGYRAAYRVFSSEDGPSRQQLGQLTCPALFMTGRDEVNSTSEMSLKMAEIALLGQGEFVDGAAHMMPMTHAAQINTHLRMFVKACHT